MSDSLELSGVRPAAHFAAYALAPVRYLARREHYFGPPSVALKVKFLLTGCVFPLACASLTLSGFDIGGSPTWQSGHFYDYILLLLHARVQLIFLPLILYSAASLGAWIFWPRAADYLAIRLGVYAGVPLAVQYLFLTVVVSLGITLICSAIAGPSLALLVFLTALLLRKWRFLLIDHLWILVLVFAVVGIAVFLIPNPEILFVIPFVMLAGAPALNLITYLRASVMIGAEHQRRNRMERRSLLIWLLALQALAAAWFASWRIAIDIMLFEYSKLPKEPPPNCYLSAAAKHRHAWLFRERGEGVSLQTKRLKFLEISFRCAAPRIHAYMRRIYDRIGPRLAAICGKSAWFADVTYLALLPLEGAAQLVRHFTAIESSSIDGIYSDKK
jgi:hypothetical protein